MRNNGNIINASETFEIVGMLWSFYHFVAINTAAKSGLIERWYRKFNGIIVLRGKNNSNDSHQYHFEIAVKISRLCKFSFIESVFLDWAIDFPIQLLTTKYQSVNQLKL